MHKLHHGHRHGFHPHLAIGGKRSWGPLSFEWDMDRSEGRGRGRKRMFDGGELRLLLLKLIVDQPRHGYDLIREIEELSGGAYAPSPGVVYPTLTLLEDMDHITEQRSEGARKQYAATDAGKAHIAEHAEAVEALLARLAHLGEARNRSDHAALRRAMGNLRQVLQHQLGAEIDKARLYEIVAVIDEAAQKIERL